MRSLLLLAIYAVAGAQSFPGDRVIAAGSDVGALSFSEDGAVLAATCADGQVRLWDARSGVVKRAVTIGKEARPVMLPTGADLIVAVAQDGSIQTWDIKSGQTMQRFMRPNSAIRPFVLSADRKLAAGVTRAADGSENTLRVWNASGSERFALPAGLGGVSAIAFSPDGGMLVAAGFDTDLRAWSVRDGELLRVMDELPLAMFAAAFSPDAKYLATAGADGIVYLWDTKTWKIARKLSGQPEMISELAFSPDGRWLLTGGMGELGRDPVQAVLWDVASGKPVRRMPSAHIVHSVAFSPDSSVVATATADQKISIWSVPNAR